jgi:hypothetical protein
MVSVLASTGVECGRDRGFEPRSGQTKDYEICMKSYTIAFQLLLLLWTLLPNNFKDQNIF